MNPEDVHKRGPLLILRRKAEVLVDEEEIGSDAVDAGETG
jgi:hypothetical protein